MRHVLDETLTGGRLLRALIVALAVLGLSLIVTLQQPLARLPDYAAVVLAFAVVIVLPGLFLQWALLGASRVDLAVRLAVATPLGLAVAAAPGLIALTAHLDLEAFAIMHSFLAAAVAGASLLVRRPRADDDAPTPEPPRTERGRLLLIGMLAVVLGGVVTTPFWAADRVAGDYDDWTYMAYVREYIDTDRLNEEEPFLGSGEGVNPRMLANVWVLSQALVADAADVPPAEVLLEYMRPMLVVLAVAAAYALTRSLFHSGTAALLAAGLLLGYGFLDLSAHEGFGRNLFLRASEDKMAAAFIVFPAGLIFLLRFVSRPTAWSFAGFALVCLALSVVHPVPLLFLATAVSALALLRVATERSLVPLRDAGLLLAPIVLASIVPFVQRELLTDAVPAVFEADAPENLVTFRDNFHVTDVGGGLLIGNFHMILHPLALTALALTPLVWLAARRSAGNQLAVAMTAGAMLVFFVPVLATPVAELMTPQTLWKMPWMVPVAPIVGYGLYLALRLLPIDGAGAPSIARRALGAVAPGVALIVILTGVLVVYEQYIRVDGNAFYDRTSSTTVVPDSDGSLLLGGVDRAFSGEWRLEPYEKELMAFLAERVPRGSTVLVEPWSLNRVMAGLLTDIYPVDFGGISGEGDRRIHARAFAYGTLANVDSLEEVIGLYGVRYFAVWELGPATPLVLELDDAELIGEVPPFVIYELQR